MAIEFPRLKLVHKVLLLVAVPLVFQCLFVVILESLWQQSRDHRRSSERSSRILVCGHKLMSSLQQSEIYRRFQSSEDFRTSNIRAKEELVALGKQLEDSDRYREKLAALTPYLILSDISETDNRSLQKFLNDWLPGEEGSIYVIREGYKQIERYIHQLIAFGMALNLVTCFFLIHYFTQNISGRVRTIVANSERFTEGKALLPVPKDDDEIGHLDKVFREMTDSITSSRQREHQFLGMVSHDLRTPLNTVFATLNSLSEGLYGELNLNGTQRVAQAEAAVERLTKLANDLLDLEKLSSGTGLLHVEPISMQHVLSRACENAAGFSSYKNVEIRLPEADRQVLANEEKLVQVFINLLSNAIKFSPDGGTVTVEFREIGTRAIEIRIADWGCGVALKDQKAIFEPFKQADEKGLKRDGSVRPAGSGLGLAICKTIIEAHGGGIGLESKPGEGAVFFVRLRRPEGQ